MRVTKISLGEAVECHQGLQELLHRYRDEISIPGAVAVSLLVRQLRKDMEVFDLERNRLVLKHGKEQEDGGFKVPAQSKAMIEFQEELTVLRNTDYEVAGELLDIESLGLEQIDGPIVTKILPVVG